MPNHYTFDDDDLHASNSNTKYEFKDSTTTKPITLKDRLSLRGSNKKSRRTNSFSSNKSSSSRSTSGSTTTNRLQDDDGTGSLTYSATSSVASDTSFNNIVKVLQQDGHDSKEIAALLKHRGIGQLHHHHQRHGSNGDEKSCAADSLAYSARSATSDSLAYSEEAESYMRMLAADGESTAHVSQVSLLQGTALLSNGQSDQSSQNAYSGLTPSYVNNGGGQRLDVTDEGNVFMMFSPAEHTDSMKRRKERKRRERVERKNKELKAKNNKVKADMQTIEEKKTQDQSDVSSVAPTVVTPIKSKTSMDDSGRTILQSNPSSQSVSVVSAVTPTRSTTKPQLQQVTQQYSTNASQQLDDEYDYNITPITPTRSIGGGSHRGSRVIIHESRGQITQQSSRNNNNNAGPVSMWNTRGLDDDSESSNGYNIQQPYNVLRSYCEEMPKDDDDMFYSKWCSFCVLDTNQSSTRNTVMKR